MMIKKYGLGFNKGLKIINLRDILLLSFYLVAVVFWAFQSLDLEHYALWKTSKILFSVYSKISRMDIEFRGGMNAYVERCLLANTLLFTEAWGDSLDTADIQYRTAISMNQMLIKKKRSCLITCNRTR